MVYSGDLSAIPEEMRELAVKALSLSFGREMALTVDSLQAARQALTKSLMEQCAARPGDFVLRRRGQSAAFEKALQDASTEASCMRLAFFRRSPC